MRRQWIAISVVGVAAYGAAVAKPGDRLVVDGSVVNLRGGPSTSQAVVAQSRQGDELRELEREGDWIKVDTGEREAWVYASLVKPRPAEAPSPRPRQADPEPAESVPETPAFREFESEFGDFNRRLANSDGQVFFASARYMGEGVVRVTATQRWLKQDENTRRSQLEPVYYMWLAAQEDRREVAVQVVDDAGGKHMKMPR